MSEARCPGAGGAASRSRAAAAPKPEPDGAKAVEGGKAAGGPDGGSVPLPLWIGVDGADDGGARARSERRSVWELEARGSIPPVPRALRCALIGGGEAAVTPAPEGDCVAQPLLCDGTVALAERGIRALGLLLVGIAVDILLRCGRAGAGRSRRADADGCAAWAGADTKALTTGAGLGARRVRLEARLRDGRGVGEPPRSGSIAALTRRLCRADEPVAAESVYPSIDALGCCRSRLVRSA